ncbi:MAG: hypothetical protein AAGL10_04280 [Pseudomonadota bacterium]
MDSLQILFFVIISASTIAGAYILIAKPQKGNALLAGGLSAVFGVYTAVQIAREGVVMFFTNHSANLTGIQVWWDLVMCVVIAFFFIAPRARAAGMNLLPWALVIGCTASIGLLAMCARLFWLENQHESAPGKPVTS